MGGGWSWQGPSASLGPLMPIPAPQGRSLFPGHVIQRLQVHGPVQPDPVYLCPDPLHGEYLQAPCRARGEDLSSVVGARQVLE